MTQGRKSVVEYESKFTSLSRYAAALIVDEEERCKMFQEGLDQQIKARIRSHHYRDYPELVWAALKAKEFEQHSQLREEK